MTRGFSRGAGGLSLAAGLATAFAVSCGGKQENEGGCTGDQDCPAGQWCNAGVCQTSASGGTGGGASPPAATGGAPGTGSSPTVLAVRRFHLEEVDDYGISSWQSYGYDIDGLASTKHSTNHCRLFTNAPPSYQEDGSDGRDNSFGKSVIPILKSFVSSPSADLNQSLDEGLQTLLIRIDGLDAQPNQVQLAGAVFRGADRGAPPSWSGDDVWPVSASSVNGSLDSPKLTFQQSYVTAGTWVVTSLGLLEIDLRIGGFTTMIPIRNATLTLQLSGTGSAASGTEGVISGVIRTEDLVGVIANVAGYVTDGQFCSDNPLFDGALSAVRQASDIMSDGSNGDSSKDCDAVSIGIGFEAVAVQLGGVLADPSPPPDPCSF